MKTAPIHLEFAPGMRAVSHRGRVMLACGIVLLGAELVNLGGSLSTRQRELSKLAEVESRLPLLAAANAPRNTKPDPAYIARVKSVRQVERGLTTPWVELLEALESAPQEAVALLAIEPSAAKHSLRLTAEARDPQAMLAYVGALQKDRRLTSVFLISHQVQVTAPGTPMRFQIQAGWGEGR